MRVRVAAANARAVAFGKSPEIGDFTAELDPAYNICKADTTKRIAMALETLILGKMRTLHEKLRAEQRQPFTARCHAIT